MTQEILSAMDSDEVNSINDTTESQQVVKVIRRAYEDIVSLGNLPEMFTLFELDPSGTITYPQLMYAPATIKEIGWVKYDKRAASADTPKFELVKPMTVEEFSDYSLQLAGKTGVATNTLDITGFGSIEFYYYQDKAPEYYCYIEKDGRHMLVFDGYNSTLESTLQASKSLCYGEKSAIFNIEDDFIPQLEDEQFSLLINEAKALAFAELKQTSHAPAEKKARKGWIHLQAEKEKPFTHFSRVPKYGRK